LLQFNKDLYEKLLLSFIFLSFSFLSAMEQAKNSSKVLFIESSFSGSEAEGWYATPTGKVSWNELSEVFSGNFFKDDIWNSLSVSLNPNLIEKIYWEPSKDVATSPYLKNSLLNFVFGSLWTTTTYKNVKVFVKITTANGKDPLTNSSLTIKDKESNGEEKGRHLKMTTYAPYKSHYGRAFVGVLGVIAVGAGAYKLVRILQGK